MEEGCKYVIELDLHIEILNQAVQNDENIDLVSIKILYNINHTYIAVNIWVEMSSLLNIEVSGLLNIIIQWSV